MIDDVAYWAELLLKGELPPERHIRKICESVSSILEGEPNVLSLASPVNICGDIHGQFPDLLELFQVGGRVGEYQYLFLGDFVDRGSFSLETFILLLVFKLKHPDRVWLLRGNHESRHVTMVYGFYDECLRKYGSPNVWKLFTNVFDRLPLAAILDGRILSLHGGLSPAVSTIDGLRSLNRKQEIPNEGPLCDILWSDPQETAGWSVSSRGAGYLFGPDVCRAFQHENGIDMICRSHQLVMEGYRWYFDKSLVTIWSAPNYCYRCGNTASILRVDETSACTFSSFGQSPSITPTRQIIVPSYFS